MSPGGKQGSATAGTQRHYMGCAGRVANGVNTVYWSYATGGGHALVGAKIWLPAGQLDDADRRVALGIGDDVVFPTKPQLVIDILTDMVADSTMPPWCAGDEVYGRASESRTFLENNGTGYVVRVGCAFGVDAAQGLRIRADELVRRFLPPASWQVCSVNGSKGEREYAWGLSQLMCKSKVIGLLSLFYQKGSLPGNIWVRVLSAILQPQVPVPDSPPRWVVMLRSPR
ncbi:transposase [Fodinicola acaciae]|uniref:transposase n=1 Tax=Fodinicola acaciae TaxID=2681555 RepID=UPI0013D5924D